MASRPRTSEDQGSLPLGHWSTVISSPTHSLDQPISPWSASSYSLDQDSLTLPPIHTSEDDPFDFTPIPLDQSLGASNQASGSSARHPNPTTTPRNQDHINIYDLSDSAEPASAFANPQTAAPVITPYRPQSAFRDLTESSPAEMPTLRKRKVADTVSEVPSKRARAAQVNTVEEVDLSAIENDEQFEEFRRKQQAEFIIQQNQEKADTPIRLADFQCVICLDNPTDLTVTHCGHLFCSLCLHEALHAGTQKSTCPVCRSSISTTARSVKTSVGTVMKPPKTGCFPLEMKLMTARRKEKMPAGVP